jgi:phage terminase large subunit GpA-like protein
MRLSQASYTHDCLPGDIAFIVCGIDTHDTCLYCETCGFSEDLKRMYGLRYDVLVGDPNDSAVWDQFYDLFNAIYTREDGRLMRPVFAFADSGGHRTNAIYLQSYRNKRFMPVKGYVSNSKNAADPLIGKQQKLNMNGGIKGKCTVQFVGVNAGKDELSNAELLTVSGEKRLYYIRGFGYNPDYFKGLLSEKKIDGKWRAPQKGHTPNEPLDTRVYAMACATYYLNKYYITGLDLEETEMARKKKNESEIVEITETETKKENVEIQPIDPPKAESVEKKNDDKQRNFPHL